MLLFPPSFTNGKSWFTLLRTIHNLIEFSSIPIYPVNGFLLQERSHYAPNVTNKGGLVEEMDSFESQRHGFLKEEASRVDTYTTCQRGDIKIHV